MDSLLTYPQTVIQSANMLARTAMQDHDNNSFSAMDWLEQGYDFHLDEWLKDSGTTLDVRATTLDRYWLALNKILFITAAGHTIQIAEEVGEQTSDKIKQCIRELRKKGNETGDWAGVFTLYHHWVETLIDET